MEIFRRHIILLFFILQLLLAKTYCQESVQVNKVSKYSYEVSCDLVFKNNVSRKLMDYCWNIENISKLLENEPVKITYSGNDLSQTISYDYTYFFMHYYSSYTREKVASTQKITFKLIKNKCDIPFVPNIVSGFGEYSITSNNETTSLHYTQYSLCNGWLSDYYLNYLKKNIEAYFKKFETEFNKSIGNAKN